MMILREIAQKTVVVSALALVFGAQALAGPSGTSVWGDEAREVYNTLVAAGATRVVIPEGPTVIVDRIDCAMTIAAGAPTAATCKCVGDPKLSTVDGAIGLRLAKGLLGMGVRNKAIDATSATVGVSSLDCGILHNVPEAQSLTAEEASCYFVDNN